MHETCGKQKKSRSDLSIGRQPNRCNWARWARPESMLHLEMFSLKIFQRQSSIGRSASDSCQQTMLQQNGTLFNRTGLLRCWQKLIFIKKIVSWHCRRGSKIFEVPHCGCGEPSAQIVYCSETTRAWQSDWDTHLQVVNLPLASSLENLNFESLNSST